MGAPNESSASSLFPKTITDLLCLLLDDKEKGNILISLDTMTGAPHLPEGVPFCSVHTGWSRVSGGAEERGDFASLPHDPSPPQQQTLLSTVSVSLGTSSLPTPDHRVAEGSTQLTGRLPPAQDQDPELRGQAGPQPYRKSSTSKTIWGRGAGVLRECDRLLTRVSLRLAREGRVPRVTRAPANHPGHTVPYLYHSIRSLGLQTMYGIVHARSSLRTGSLPCSPLKSSGLIHSQVPSRT